MWVTFVSLISVHLIIVACPLCSEWTDFKDSLWYINRHVVIYVAEQTTGCIGLHAPACSALEVFHHIRGFLNDMLYINSRFTCSFTYLHTLHVDQWIVRLPYTVANLPLGWGLCLSLIMDMAGHRQTPVSATPLWLPPMLYICLYTSENQ